MELLLTANPRCSVAQCAQAHRNKVWPQPIPLACARACGASGERATLANQAHELESNSTSRWLASLDTKKFVDASRWFWILFDGEYQQHWHQHQLWFQRPWTTPATNVLTELLPQEIAPIRTCDDCNIRLRFTTCNVLSLCGQH